MHAQYEHSPPTLRSSTIATASPASASRPAATSPPGPAPITTTSNVAMPLLAPRRSDPVSDTATACGLETLSRDPNEAVWKRPVPRLQWRSTPGTTGFDVVGSWGRLRVEVPEAS